MDDLTIVLKYPARAANVGAAARALKVMGFSRLVLVSPSAPLDGEAYAVAHGARDVLEGARIVDRLEEALEGATVVVGTTARQGKDRMTPVKLRKFVSEILPTHPQARLAVVFGSEESGLSNADLEHCQYAVEIPTGPIFHSLNLSHAVMVVCYELRLFLDAPRAEPEGPDPTAGTARRRRMESLYRALDGFLEEVGYPTGSSRTRAVADLRRVLDPAWLTERDVNTVLGLLRHLRWKLRHPDASEQATLD
jgi:tRNA/rRNA methyltransferase